MIPRQEAMLILGILFLVGILLTIARLLRARKHGLSIRLQVFVVLASTTFLLFGVFATIVVERFHARVVLFTHRAAADDAQVVGTLATKMLESLDLS
ncbi:MAG: hypothetical protein GY854_06330, partial [Deltaproteobacteria bacterium]|nr:hypothetical protein [Deltaproteobacteria bacterium]